MGDSDTDREINGGVLTLSLINGKIIIKSRQAAAPSVLNPNRAAITLI